MQADRRPTGRARLTDRVEDVAAWLLVVLAAGVVGVALLVGRSGYDATLAGPAPTGQVSVDAVLLDTAIAAPGPPVALARWTRPDGGTVVGRIKATAGRLAGDHVAVLVDRVTGAPVPAGPDPAAAALVGWTRGAAVVVAGWTLLVLAWFGIRALTTRANARALTRDWARVEPLWSGRAR